MKEQLKKLNRILQIECLNPDNYYVINVYESEIKFQGKFDSDLAKELKKLFKGSGISDQGYAEFNRNDIEIILT